MTFLLTTGRTGYYEGLRQFYNRETRSDSDRIYRVLLNTSNSNEDGICVTTDPDEPGPRSLILDIHVNPNACNESTSFLIL